MAGLYGQPAPPGTRELVGDAAVGTELGRLRLTVLPDPERATPTANVTVAPVAQALVFPGWAGAVDLTPVAVAGGIGAHKWADRRLIGRAEASTDPALPLIVDSDGALLEGSRGSLFLVVGEGVLTPAADGRLLPGITRAQVLKAAGALGMEVREEVLGPDRLAGADEAFMAGAVRGVEPVRRYAGVREWAAGEVTARLAAELRRLWLG